MTPPRCPRCDGRMTEGFVVDQGDGNSKKVPRWQPGQPIRRWYGLKTTTSEQKEVATVRCDRCGLLESYAP